MSQLADIVEDLQAYSAKAAERLTNELVNASLRLADFPNLGRAVPEGGFTELRELFVGKYRLVYTVGDFQVEIVTVLHQAQRR